jgi:hypothetical protein
VQDLGLRRRPFPCKRSPSLRVGRGVLSSWPRGTGPSSMDQDTVRKPSSLSPVDNPWVSSAVTAPTDCSSSY